MFKEQQGGLCAWNRENQGKRRKEARAEKWQVGEGAECRDWLAGTLAFPWGEVRKRGGF